MDSLIQPHSLVDQEHATSTLLSLELIHSIHACSIQQVEISLHKVFYSMITKVSFSFIMVFLVSEVAIGNQLSDSIGIGQFRYYIFPFLTGGVTVRVEVFRGGVWCYASDTNRNPNGRDYTWRLFISEYNDSYIDPTSLGRAAGAFLFIAIEGMDINNDFTLNSTTGDTSIASNVLKIEQSIMQ